MDAPVLANKTEVATAVDGLYERMAEWAGTRGPTAKRTDIGIGIPLLVVEQKLWGLADAYRPQVIFDPLPQFPREDGAVEAFAPEAADGVTLFPRDERWLIDLPDRGELGTTGRRVPADGPGFDEIWSWFASSDR